MHQRMCMRSKAWLAASVSLRLARLPPLQASRLRLRQAFSRMLWSQNSRKLTIYSDAMPYSGMHTLCFRMLIIGRFTSERLGVSTPSCLPPYAHVQMRALKSLARCAPARARAAMRSRRLRATLAAAPVRYAHAFDPCHMDKIYSISGM
jgi:hypothetical protein